MVFQICELNGTTMGADEPNDWMSSWHLTTVDHNSKPMSPTLGQHTHSAQVSCWSFVLEVISVMSLCWVDYLVWLAYIDAGTLACSVGSWCIAFGIQAGVRPARSMLARSQVLAKSTVEFLADRYCRIWKLIQSMHTKDPGRFFAKGQRDTSTHYLECS